MTRHRSATNHSARLPLPLLAALSLAACATAGRFDAVNVTNVELSNPNYRVIARDVTGQAAATYLLGFSGSSGSQVTVLAMFRVAGSGLLFHEALQNLWANFERDHGSPQNRSLALVNVRVDADAINVLGLVTRPKIAVRADVVEFLRP